MQPKHLVITGGEGGLALAIRPVFESAGWQVDSPGRAELDVTDARAVSAYLTARTPDLLICTAGITRDAPLARLDEESWDAVMAANYRGVAACAAAVLPSMVAQNQGHIVFISSRSAIHPPAGQAAYAAAKAAVLGLTRSLATAYGSHSIRVNAILPGFLETPMTASVSTKRRAEVLGEHVLGRFNTPAAVARFLLHLHEELPAVSGQVFQLDSRIS
ncbi:MAG: SDR family oxidoreductase [Verrucomicrobiaceae bacterium]|nr:MAG: SDR family oxidoreductase [Verrucomicrobiaceae bacterium]